MPTCLIIHGVSGSSRENWFPWFKSELEKRAWKVLAPDLPNAEHPKVLEWNSALLSLVGEFDENSVIVGHSLGVPAGLNLAQALGKKIGKLILVAPVNRRQEWGKLMAEVPDLDWQAVKNFAEINFDWQKIANLAKQIIFYYSDNDKYIPLSSIDFYKEHLPAARYSPLSGKGHFNTASGVAEFPELLIDLLRV